MDHLKDLFEKEEYLQAIETNFVTQSKSYSWQMTLIFVGIFLVLIASACMMCRFMGDKDKKRDRESRTRNGRSQASDVKYHGGYGQSERDLDYRVAEGFSRNSSDRESSEDFCRK